MNFLRIDEKLPPYDEDIFLQISSRETVKRDKHFWSSESVCMESVVETVGKFIKTDTDGHHFRYYENGGVKSTALYGAKAIGWAPIGRTSKEVE